MKTIAGILTAVLIATSYVLQNYIMGIVQARYPNGVPNGWPTAAVFTVISVFSALIPFLLYMIAILAIIRRQDR